MALKFAQGDNEWQLLRKILANLGDLIGVGGGGSTPPTSLAVTVVNNNSNPVNVTSTPATGSWADRSGQIGQGGSAQTVASANTSRKYLYFQNVSNADLWINFGTVATASQPSLLITSRAAFVLEAGFINTTSISVIGATTGQQFTCKEG